MSWWRIATRSVAVVDACALEIPPQCVDVMLLSPPDVLACAERPDADAKSIHQVKRRPLWNHSVQNQGGK